MRVPSSRALFDLAHLDGLSDAPGLVLLVSERTLYLLQNLVTLDIIDHVRYAIERYGEGEYVPVVEGDAPEWALFSDVADKAAQEVIEVGRMPLYGITEAIGTIDTYPVPGAGSYAREFGPVPAGELWEVQALDAECSVSNPTSIIFQFTSLLTAVTVQIVNAPGAGINVLWQGRVVVGPGDKITFYYSGVGAGSTLKSRVWFAQLVQ